MGSGARLSFRHFCNIGEFESALAIIESSSKSGEKEKFRTKMVVALAHVALESLDFDFAAKCYAILMGGSRCVARAPG